MSCDNENVSDTNLEKLNELTNKLNRCNKNVKLVLELLQKLHEASEKKPQGSYVAKGSSEYKNKKHIYLTKLNNKEIKKNEWNGMKMKLVIYLMDDLNYFS